MTRMPDFIEPMLATLVAAPFDDAGWVFETKWDGFRVQAAVRGGVVRTWTRGGKDAAGYFGSFLAPPTWIEADEAIVDGEVVALDARGEPSFGALGAGGRLIYQRARRRHHASMTLSSGLLPLTIDASSCR